MLQPQNHVHRVVIVQIERVFAVGRGKRMRQPWVFVANGKERHDGVFVEHCVPAAIFQCD